MLHALILEDDGDSRQALAALVDQEGFSVSAAATLAEARRLVGAQAPDIALVDQSLPDGSGLDLLEELEAQGTETVVITGHASVDSAVQALRLRVRDYLVKPIDVLRLKTILGHVTRTRELKREIATLRNALLELGRFGGMIGSSPGMQEVYQAILRVAPTDVPVLIVGESGTGKELVAEALHGLSSRTEREWRAVNCAAISPTLIESELFGHEKGSFTGATRQHRGFFEQASGGTLFLDEIAEMPLELQAKLLRALESGMILRVGGERPVPVDVRVIAATNRDPDEAVRDGRIREDLYYRIGAFRIRLPPLRDRGEDLMLLAEHFLSRLNKERATNKRFTRGVRERLPAYSWPGNVRELHNAVQQAYLVADDEITPQCFLLGEGEARSNGKIAIEIGVSLAEADRRLILATLDRFAGDKKKAAETLGISLKTLYNRLHAYGLRAS